ncbi:signal recognition particle, SRP9/SRP14 subunit [Lactarius akahatsu]|uniref:Signal recognition particle, SRP9/SRP14 subunit n=1 Tax=Lactarius akahatsu TaxID=416441 RepID=A0AAD4LIW8_9AGAM|nr:signal recognition particle, SRP9/SRP14 subunit [Lactarius akahatsu]
MVYISSWQEYQEAADNLYTNSPRKTRYTVKWKSSEGILVLKITDDVTCLKFKTHSSIFLGRFEALNRSLIQKMTNSPLKPIPTALSAPPPQAIAASPVIQGGNLSETPVPASAPSGGGVKKKKGGKRR